MSTTQIWTPSWMVDRMISCVPSLKGHILDLCAGEGAFVRGLIKAGVHPSNITAVEIDPRFKNVLEAYGVEVLIGDYKAALDGKAGQYDVVFSNPPYQVQSVAQKGREGSGSVQAKPIYHEVVMYTIDVLKSQYVCMITPSRWMVGGMGLGDYRARMLKDRNIRLIQDFPGTYDVFEDIGGIAGGVSYFLWDRDYNGLCEFNGVQRNIGEFDIIVRDHTSCLIMKKVLVKHTEPFCIERAFPNKPFGLPTNFRGWVADGTPGSVKCYSVGRKVNCVSLDDMRDNHGILGKYKVCTSKARSQGIIDAEGNRQPSPVLGTTFQISKGDSCTETYVVLAAFNTKKEADNFEAYLRLKFPRFCLMQRLISQDVNKSKFSWVPDLEDYSKAWTDEELYAHFGLTKKEIEHIEKTIKGIK